MSTEKTYDGRPAKEFADEVVAPEVSRLVAKMAETLQSIRHSLDVDHDNWAAVNRLLRLEEGLKALLGEDASPRKGSLS